MTKDILDLCEERRDMKKRQYDAGAETYGEANKMIQKAEKRQRMTA